MRSRGTIFFVGGNREVKVGGGANVSLSSLESLLSRYGFEVHSVGSNNTDLQGYSFGRIGHISFSPLLKMSLEEIMKNWKDALSLLLYCYKNTMGISKLNQNDSVIINNGHWCLKSDIVVIRFLMKSYVRRLESIGFIKTGLSIFDLKTRVILWLERKILYNESVKKIIVLSDESRSDFMLNYNNLTKKIVTIPNGVDFDRFRFSKRERGIIRKKLKVGPKETAILFIGGNIFRKNLALAIDVANYLENEVKLIVLVKEEEIEKAEEMSSVCKNVIVLPWEENPSKYYSACDILISPTIYDTGSKVILEALVNGLYCIVSNHSGVGDFIGKNEGVVLDKLSVHEYTKAILDYKSRNKSRSRGSLVWSWEKVSKEWLNLIKEVQND
jgi:glycosyltransferase involved in cell wall biosynthesis